VAYVAGPFSAMHLYVQWGGKLPGSEQWSCGLRLINVGGGVANDDTGMLAAVSTAVEDYHTRALTSIGNNALLSFVKVNAIGTDGHYVANTTNEHIAPDATGGATAASPFPNQIALAVSLTTGFSRGPAHRGRFYLPLPYTSPGVDGTIPAGTAGGVHTSTTTFLAALNAVNAAWKVGVMSRKSGAPAARVVTGVEVGRVLDTQRRRRNKLVENYQ